MILKKKMSTLLRNKVERIAPKKFQGKSNILGIYISHLKLTKNFDFEEKNVNAFAK